MRTRLALGAAPRAARAGLSLCTLSMHPIKYSHVVSVLSSSWKLDTISLTYKTAESGYRIRRPGSTLGVS